MVGMQTRRQEHRFEQWAGRWLVLLCLGLLASPLVTAAEVTATLDRDRIVLGETVTLLLQTDDPSQSLDGLPAGGHTGCGGRLPLYERASF